MNELSRSSQPLVSVVIPTYKRATLLPRAVDSVLSQTYENWELIVVDGKSDDGTAALMRRYRMEMPERIVFIEQDDHNCCAARNTGIEVARGEFVAFLDSDDRFLPTKLERQMELFSLRPELGFVFGDYAFVDLQNRRHVSAFDEHHASIRRVPSIEIAPHLRVCGGSLFQHLLRNYFIATIVAVVRKDVLGQTIRFNPEIMYGHEWLFFLDIAARTPAGFVDEPLCVHYHTAGSLTRTCAVENSLHQRRLYSFMYDRYRGFSRSSDRHLLRALGRTCLQLGYDSYRSAAYRSALGHFWKAFRSQPRARTAAYLAQAGIRALLGGGGFGRAAGVRPAD